MMGIYVTCEDDNGEDFVYEASESDLADFAIAKFTEAGANKETARRIIAEYGSELINAIAFFDEDETKEFLYDRAREEYDNWKNLQIDQEREYLRHVLGGLK